MSRVQSSVSRGTSHSYSVDRQASLRPKLYSTTKSTKKLAETPHVIRDDAQVAAHHLKFLWLVAALKTLFIPVAIFMIAATYDVVPWAPSAGAFVIAAGVLFILASFPLVNQYRSLLIDVEQTYGRYEKPALASFTKLHRLLFIGALCAELPSALGMLHFMLTYELISSLLLCSPAMLIMFVAYRPVELRRKPKAAAIAVE